VAIPLQLLRLKETAVVMAFPQGHCIGAEAEAALVQVGQPALLLVMVVQELRHLLQVHQ
jgi:hypothetical protein